MWTHLKCSDTPTHTEYSMNKWSNWQLKPAAAFLKKIITVTKRVFILITIYSCTITRVTQFKNYFKPWYMKKDSLFLSKRWKATGARATLFVHMQHYCKFTKGINLARQQCNTALTFDLPLSCPPLSFECDGLHECLKRVFFVYSAELSEQCPCACNHGQHGVVQYMQHIVCGLSGCE